MSFKFTDHGNGLGELSCKRIIISIVKEHQQAYRGTAQNDNIRGLLAGERELRGTLAMYDERDDEGSRECIGDYDFTIDYSGQFTLCGGSNDPTSCIYVSMNYDYAANKEDIDNFMRFMLVGE